MEFWAKYTSSTQNEMPLITLTVAERGTWSNTGILSMLCTELVQYRCGVTTKLAQKFKRREQEDFQKFHVNGSSGAQGTMGTIWEAQTPHEGSQTGSQRYCAVLEKSVGLNVLLPTDLSCDNKHGRHRFIDVLQNSTTTTTSTNNKTNLKQIKKLKQNPTKKLPRAYKGFYLIQQSSLNS